MSLRIWLILFILSSLLIAAATWLYLNVQASMYVTAQEASIRLSDELPTKIAVGNYLQAQAKGMVETQIPLNHAFNLPIEGRYPANLAFEVEVPIEVDIDYQTLINVDQTMPLETTTDLIYQKKYLPRFPLKLDIPIQLDVPFHLKQRYRIPVKIQFDGPVQLDLDENLNVHVRHLVKTKMMLNDPIVMRDIAEFRATMRNIERDTKANLSMQMNLNLDQIHP